MLGAGNIAVNKTVRFPTCGEVCSSGPTTDLEQVVVTVIVLRGKVLWSMQWENLWDPACKQLTCSGLDGGSQKLCPANPQSL